jgi:hypothetical protein
MIPSVRKVEVIYVAAMERVEAVRKADGVDKPPGKV